MSGAAGRVFWPDCGHTLLGDSGSGPLRLTDALLAQLLRRPELSPVAESCERERMLHAALLADPRRPFDEADIGALVDPDARDSYRVLRAFRDHLLAFPALEPAYLALVDGRGAAAMPPPLVDWLVQLIVARLLVRADADAYRLRAAELFFRAQRVGIDNGIALVDAERFGRRQPRSLQLLQSLIAQADIVGAPQDRRASFDALNATTLERCWSGAARGAGSELVLGLDLDGPGLAALCWLLQAWVDHFHDLDARVVARREIRTARWRWHLGLDADSNRLLNALYRGESLDDAERRRLLLLFTLRAAPGRLRGLNGTPVYLGLAMDAGYTLRMKPQNLLLNLPLGKQHQRSRSTRH